MTSKRSYREALDAKVARDEIERCSGGQFDPEIVKVFLDIYENDNDELKDIMEKYKE